MAAIVLAPVAVEAVAIAATATATGVSLWWNAKSEADKKAAWREMQNGLAKLTELETYKTSLAKTSVQMTAPVLKLYVALVSTKLLERPGSAATKPTPAEVALVLAEVARASGGMPPGPNLPPPKKSGGGPFTASLAVMTTVTIGLYQLAKSTGILPEHTDLPSQKTPSAPERNNKEIDIPLSPLCFPASRPLVAPQLKRGITYLTSDPDALKTIRDFLDGKDRLQPRQTPTVSESEKPKLKISAPVASNSGSVADQATEAKTIALAKKLSETVRKTKASGQRGNSVVDAVRTLYPDDDLVTVKGNTVEFKVPNLRRIVSEGREGPLENIEQALEQLQRGPVREMARYQERYGSAREKLDLPQAPRNPPAFVTDQSTPLFFPPGGGAPNGGDAHSEFNFGLHERVSQIREVLREANIPSTFIPGRAPVNSMRKEPYHVFVLPGENALLFICDQANNASYLIRGTTDYETVGAMTKFELQANPTYGGKVQVIEYPKLRIGENEGERVGRWGENILEAIQNPTLHLIPASESLVEVEVAAQTRPLTILTGPPWIQRLARILSTYEGSKFEIEPGKMGSKDDVSKDVTRLSPKNLYDLVRAMFSLDRTEFSAWLIASWPWDGAIIKDNFSRVLTAMVHGLSGQAPATSTSDRDMLTYLAKNHPKVFCELISILPATDLATREMWANSVVAKDPGVFSSTYTLLLKDSVEARYRILVRFFESDPHDASDALNWVEPTVEGSNEEKVQAARTILEKLSGSKIPDDLSFEELLVRMVRIAPELGQKIIRGFWPNAKESERVFLELAQQQPYDVQNLMSGEDRYTLEERKNIFRFIFKADPVTAREVLRQQIHRFESRNTEDARPKFMDEVIEEHEPKN